MKKKIYLLAGTLFVLSLCSCSIQISTDGNHQESSSATTSSSSSGVILLKLHQLQKFPTVRTFLSATLQRILRVQLLM